jgi:GNAT superfamily N-acetyltransferase
MVKNFGKEIRLVRATKKDTRFVYEVVKDWLNRHADHSVTVLKMPSFAKFSKSKSTRYIIKKGKTSIGFVHILANNEIGYYMIPEFQGKGIGTWAVFKMMKMQPRDRYFATVNNKNIGSVKLITSLGFRPKATIYEKIVSKKT